LALFFQEFLHALFILLPCQRVLFQELQSLSADKRMDFEELDFIPIVPQIVKSKVLVFGVDCAAD
jgi:hypothetical protein